MTQFKAIDSIKMGEGTRNYCLCERTSIIVTKIVSQWKKMKRGHFYTQEAISALRRPFLHIRRLSVPGGCCTPTFPTQA